MTLLSSLVKCFAGSVALGFVPGKLSIPELEKCCPSITKWFWYPCKPSENNLEHLCVCWRQKTPFRGCGSLPWSPPWQPDRCTARRSEQPQSVPGSRGWAILPWLTGLWGLSAHKWHTHAGTNKTLAIAACNSLAASRGKECTVIWCLHYLHNTNQFVSKLLCSLIPDCRENQAGREDYYLQPV